MDNFESFVNSMGSLVEMWTIAYGNFLKCGFSREEAICQTEAFFRVMLGVFSPSSQEKDKGE